VIHTSHGWVSALDPFLIQFSDSFGIRWYGLAYLLGFLLTYFIAVSVGRKERWSEPAAMASDFVFVAALGTILGGRLGYCIFYDPALFSRFTGEFPFWGVLMIHKGGMASHGGMVGIVLTSLWFARTRGVALWSLLDVVALAGCIGIFFGRIANFINGELVGRPASPDLAWSVRFPQDLYGMAHGDAGALAPLAPVVTEVGVSSARWAELVEAGNAPHIAPVIDSLIIRIQHGDQVLAEKLAPFLVPRHPSQLYEALLEGLLLGIACVVSFKRALYPGGAAVTFLLLYPVARIIGEQFRMPDPQLGFRLFDLTRGQWLSIIMLVVAVGAWFWRSRSLLSNR
jgi:phosphatidylglycerol:prolipoprotein diacylglycerol transferase